MMYPYILRAIGVPTEDQYPKRCIISLKQFPDYPKKDIGELIPGVSETGIDLFYVSQQLPPVVCYLLGNHCATVKHVRLHNLICWGRPKFSLIMTFQNLMRFDLAERITAANALEHAWFDDIITFKKPLRMTRQRHSMSLAGPIPSLADVDTEVEIRSVKFRSCRSCAGYYIIKNLPKWLSRQWDHIQNLF